MTGSSIHFTPQLLEQVALGNTRAFAELYNILKDKIFSVAMGYTRSELRSEEIVQDVFIRIWKNREKLASIENPDAWFFHIARNRGLTALKQIARQQKIQQAELSYIPGQSPASDANLATGEIAQLVNRALDLLSPQQKKVFELSRLQGMSRDEVARVMGISKATVSVHLTIAVRIVRSFLASHLELEILLLLVPALLN